MTILHTVYIIQLTGEAKLQYEDKPLQRMSLQGLVLSDC
jgi:hypothetical protein